MIRALFVDDEPALLEGLENRLRRLRSRWKTSFAASAEAALAKLAVEAFDVVVSDLRMPGMDGAALLRRVRTDQPGVIRIVLTGETGPDVLMRSLPVAHQMLSKPCDPQQLDAAVQRVRALHGLLDDAALRSVVSGISRLPPLPRVHLELNRKLEEPDARPGDVAAIVTQDAALTARVLQLANSGFMGIGRTVISVADAVKYLGLTTLRSVVRSSELFQAFDPNRVPEGFSLEYVHEHSLRCARIAERLAGDDNSRKLAVSAAILHDLGRVLIASALPDYLPAALEHARRESVPLHLAEYAVHGFSHAEVGAYLLALWGLPAAIVDAVAHHHRPSRAQESTFGALGALHVADRLSHDSQLRMAGTSFESVHAGATDLAYLDRVAVRDRVDGWREMLASDAPNSA